jgi:hypothetical protein
MVSFVFINTLFNKNVNSHEILFDRFILPHSLCGKHGKIQISFRIPAEVYWNDGKVCRSSASVNFPEHKTAPPLAEPF